jgi:hypothetical protein
MDRKNLNTLINHFNAFIVPLLNQEDPEDYHMIWEFQKFFHAKRLKVLTSESETAKKWKESLLSR